MTTARGIEPQPNRIRSLATFDSVVDALIAGWRERARREQRWFATQSPFKPPSRLQPWRSVLHQSTPENRQSTETAETLTRARNACSYAGMSNVLDDEKQQQIRALGRLGWTLSRIERTTDIRGGNCPGAPESRGHPGAWSRVWFESEWSRQSETTPRDHSEGRELREDEEELGLPGELGGNLRWPSKERRRQG
jgi:hypothetical protein